MKIIEMLDKMAIGEISTKAKVKYGNARYKHNNGESLDYYIYKEFGKRCESEIKDFLNDEIEIIEEDKKIIRLEFEEGNIEDKLFLARYITHNRAKINELIDEVNKLK